jgi:flagellar biosynthesis GTPase FlhF
MIIANPIYDVIFKYFMEDSKVAKLLISSIIGQTIDKIELRPQEISIANESLCKYTIYRMDFSALIQTPQGQKTIIIEVQKAKKPGDIIRFRQYLGSQYSNPENSYLDDKTTCGIPIISIYFLGYALNEIDAPVLHVQMQYKDMATGLIYDLRDEFIEGLTHDCFVVQSTRLKKRRRNELETILAVFDPDNSTDDKHILNVNEEDFPEKYRPIIRRLQIAAESKELREAMQLEDQILRELAERERENARMVDGLKKSVAEKEQTIAEKEQAIAEKEQAIAEKEALITEERKAKKAAELKAEEERQARENLEKELAELRKKLN